MQINIEKRAVMIILGIILLLAGGIVYAYGTSSPSAFGHSIGELGIRESGYSIYLFPSGTSYQDCRTTCNGQMQIVTSNTTPVCFSYTGGEARDDCRSTQVKCGDYLLGTEYCATKNLVNITVVGKILVD